jgi:beta-phosphoglucomutase family hydrolase
MDATGAVIFDMDGVIIDNNKYHKEAWHRFCHSYGFELTNEDLEKHIFGRTNNDALTFLFNENLTRNQLLEYTEHKENIYRSIYADDIQPVQGLISFLVALRQNSILTAVATSAPKSNLDFVMSKLSIEGYFDILVDSDAIVRGKPDPEIYLKTASLLNKEPRHCIVFEDSLSGIQAAKRAGMRVVGLSTTHSADELDAANMVISNFEEMGLEKLSQLEMPAN